MVKQEVNSLSINDKPVFVITKSNINTVVVEMLLKTLKVASEKGDVKNCIRLAKYIRKICNCSVDDFNDFVIKCEQENVEYPPKSS